MDVARQIMELQEFHRRCMHVIYEKNPDYTPDGVPLLDALGAAVDTDISIPKAMWILLHKHMSAVRKFAVLNQSLSSEPIERRILDAVNHLSLIDLYIQHRAELHQTWFTYWSDQACECDGKPATCQRCRTLFWLGRNTLPND